MKGTYNGHANRETWAVCLWLDNDQSSQEYWLQAAREALADAQEPKDMADEVLTPDQRARYSLAERMKAEIKDEHPLVDQATLYSDLLASALARVEWHDVAQRFIDDAKEGY